MLCDLLIELERVVSESKLGEDRSEAREQSGIINCYAVAQYLAAHVPQALHVPVVWDGWCGWVCGMGVWCGGCVGWVCGMGVLTAHTTRAAGL